jgi:hypothetical protein
MGLATQTRASDGSGDILVDPAVEPRFEATLPSVMRAATTLAGGSATLGRQCRYLRSQAGSIHSASPCCNGPLASEFG